MQMILKMQIKYIDTKMDGNGRQGLTGACRICFCYLQQFIVYNDSLTIRILLYVQTGFKIHRLNCISPQNI